MRSSSQYLLLTLTVLPMISVGCSTSRHQLARQDSPPSQLDRTDEDTTTSPESEERPSIRAVSFHYDEEAEVPRANSSSTESQLAVPAELESIAAGEVGLTLDYLEQLALANNPAIKQVSAASAQAGGIRTQVGLRPNPTIGYNGTQIADAGTDQHTAFVEQTFVRGDKLALNRRVIDHDVNAMNWQIEAQRQRILTDVRVAFFDALAAQERLRLAREFHEVAKKGVAVSEAQVEAKIGTRPDVLQSEIQLNEVDLAIQQAEFELTAALKELTALTGVPSFGRSSLDGNFGSALRVRDEESEFAQIVAASPQLAAAQARVDRARANLERQRAQPIPNVTAQLGAGYDNGTGQGLVNVQLGLPIPVHNRNQGNIQAAHAEFCAATQNVDRIRAEIRRDLARVMREYSIAEATVRRYETSILPKVEETMSLMQEAQEAGEFDFLRVLTARRSYFDANLRYVTAQGQLAQANARIDGLLLSDGLSQSVIYQGDDGLRGQSLDGQ